MPTASIQSPGTRIVLESERLVAFMPSQGDGPNHETRRDMPLRDLERIVMGEGVSVTSPALIEMLRRGIPISFIDAVGRFLGSFLPAAPDHGAARLRHYQRSMDPDFAISITRELLAAKIHNQRRLVQRVSANRRAEDRPLDPLIQTSLKSMEQSLAALSRADSLESLRGHEGMAAARYFAAWARLLPDEFAFDRRSTRPPLNPVNAVLSFTSTLIYTEMHTFIHAHGLDAAFGLLHATENGRWALALDLMEPFRPVIAEALTLDLFSHKMLNASNFEPHQGGIYLTRDGRNKLILQYEKRMERQFLSEQFGHRTTLRQQLENHAIRFKSSLDTPAEFTAFRMN